jgi:hypothetical protein
MFNGLNRMEVHRAPIQQTEIALNVTPDPRPRTRCGYLVPEAYEAYETALKEQGAIASGKVLHFAADLICSGGLDIWIRGLYNYAFHHINLANPRIFVYLRHKIAELDKYNESLPQETFFHHKDVQSCIAETVLVLQICPKRAKLAWPKLDENTKRPGWLRGVAGAAEMTATRRVWSSDGDTPPLYLVSNELCKAISEGSLERSLFWVRWVLEEDSRMRKETKGHGLSTQDRGPATCSQKARTEVGWFVADLLKEVYRDLASRNLIRMNEEFAELQRLYRNGEIRMAASLRRDCLALMVSICCEVPRWRVPAAPTLVPDPIRLSRAVGMSSSFFGEVLAHPALAIDKVLKPKMTKKERKNKKITEKDAKAMSLDEHFDAYEAAMNAYLNKF